MKLATENNGTPDGRLLVVARDLRAVADASAIAASLQQALECWDAVEPVLQQLYERLNAGACKEARAYADVRFDAPLPRAWQWLDGSAYATHAELMAQAFKQPPIEHDKPLMYQGLSHRFYGPHDDVPFVDAQGGIDFEGEFGVITTALDMAPSREEAAAAIRLLVQINDWSLRHYAVPEMKTGFGWILAKPACSMAPVALTPDELGAAWRDTRVTATLDVFRGDEHFGAVPGEDMNESFADLVAHAARTRDLCAGTIIGSGTVSHPTWRDCGSCCIAERRAIEMIAGKEQLTPYLGFGERVRMQARLPGSDDPLFGCIDQRVVQHRRPA